MSGINTEHIIMLIIVVFMLYHFMNRCGNGFSVGGEDCWDWDSEFTCLSSNVAFWKEDCEWVGGTCYTETEADSIRAHVEESRRLRKVAVGLPASATHDELKAAEAQAELLAKNALRAAENPDGIVECPRFLAARVDSFNLANHQTTTLWGNINSDCGDSRISDICRNHQHHRAARSHPHVAGIEGCNKCYEERSDGTYACEYSGVTCERGAECFAYSYDNMCNGGIGVTIQPEDICK